MLISNYNFVNYVDTGYFKTLFSVLSNSITFPLYSKFKLSSNLAIVSFEIWCNYNANPSTYALS